MQTDGWRAAAVGLAVVLGGCASVPEDGPPPPESIPDISAIPEPDPRIEPRSSSGNPLSYQVAGRTYHVLDSNEGYVERGGASWYGTKFHGRRTSSGEPYDMYAMTAAHKTLPIPSYVRVTRLDNGRSVVVRVNDRGPFAEGRIIDLSYAAAAKLGMVDAGTAPVEVRALLPERRAYTSAASAEPGPEQPIFLQVGAFSERINAERLRRQLAEALPDEPVVIRHSDSSSRPLFRVHLGPATSQAELERLTGAATRLGLDALRVVAARNVAD